MKRIVIIIFNLLVSATVFSQFDEFADSFDTLFTIAGKGEINKKSTNGWLSTYEGGDAVNAELSRPHNAIADLAGNIYIADKGAHSIRKINLDGTIQTVAGTNVAGDDESGIATQCRLSSPNGLWVKSDGTVYIVDLGNSKIKRVTTNGHIETVVNDEDGYTSGRGLWVTENEDSIFYANGINIKLWTKENGIEIYSSGYSELGNIAMDKNGFLIATDRSANAVYRIAKDGSEKVVIAGNGSTSGGESGMPATEVALHGVRGIWFLEDNSYFLATHEGSQIWYVDILGNAHLFLNGKSGNSNHTGDEEIYSSPGYKISEARSVSVDYQGNVIIVENDKGFVRKIQKKIQVSDSCIQQFNLETGWNLIGIAFNAKDSTILSIFPNAEYVKNMNDFWTSTQQDYLNGLNKLEFGNGYFIYNSVNETICIK